MAKNKFPKLLAFSRSLNPGHFLMYSAAATGSNDITPIGIREEPLRGLNATAKTPEDKKTQAVLQVVESAELHAGHEVLVLKGRVLVKNQSVKPHSCNEATFAVAHAGAIAEIAQAGGFKELARRYALTMASASLAWRNALEAESVRVTIGWGTGQEAIFDNLLLADEIRFDYEAPDYAVHKAELVRVATAIESALTRQSGRGTNFRIRVDLVLGLGARVYPSQEWPSAVTKKESKQRWPGGEGVTRILAKLRLPDGSAQAIINDRKVGNALRVIDTWYPSGDESHPIAVEPYGASAHESRAFRTSLGDSAFGLMRRVAEGEVLSGPEGLYYAAVCIRGGVFGASEE